jgi:hypothetical protein
MAEGRSAIPHDRLGTERIGGQFATPRGAPFKAMGPQLATLKVLALKAGEWQKPHRTN